MSQQEERSELSKTLKPQWVWAIALGSAVGWGSFVLPSDWIADAGPLGAMLGLTIGAVLVLVIAVSYGFMVRSFPVSGGEFTYAYLGFGRRQAYVCGWFLALGYICTVALNASALALLARFVLPGIANLVPLYSVAGWQVHLGEIVVSSAVLVLFAWMNIRGSSLSGRLQFVFCNVMIAGVVLTAVAVILHPDTSTANVTPLFAPETSAIAAILAIVAIAPWAYMGFDNVPQAAEEFDFSASKAFGLIVLAIIAAAVIYATMIFATAMSMPWQQLVEQDPDWGTGRGVSGLFGVVGTLVLSLALIMGICTGMNGFYVSASRLLFAMGRARILPKVFGKLHPEHGTPYAGLLFTCAACLAAPWFGREALLWIVSMSAVGVTVAYFYACFVAYRLYRWSDGSDPVELANIAIEGRVAPAKKALALAGSAIALGFLGLLVVPGSPGFLSGPSWVALLVWVALGAGFYWLRADEYLKIDDEEMDHLIFGERPAELQASSDREDEPSTEAGRTEREAVARRDERGERTEDAVT